MAGSIKLFQFVQSYHRAIGIYPSQPNQKQYAINTKSVICLVCWAQTMITTTAFLALDANTVFDYGFGFYDLLGSINSIIICALFAQQYENFTNFIENCEGFIKMSK